MATRMEPVAARLRRWSKRVRAFWDAAPVLKRNGVEDRVIAQIRAEVEPTIFTDDHAIWYDLFPRLVYYRRCLDLLWSIALYGGALYLYYRGSLSVEAFVLLFFSFQRITQSLQEVSDAQRDIQRDLAQINDYRVQLVGAPTRHYREGLSYSGAPVSVQFEEVSLDLGSGAHQKPVLRNISFSLRAGERVGIVGPSGAGKSKLVELLCCAYAHYDGSIRVGDVDLATLASAHWLQHVAVVSQEVTVLEGSVRENVCLTEHTAHENDDTLIWTALEYAGLDLSGRLTEGLDTPVGTRGLRLSGGERQRLVIAQALYKLLCREREGTSSLLIVDEGTAALDSASEAHVLESLYSHLPAGTTILKIAHRLSTLYGCQAIIEVVPVETCASEQPNVRVHASLADCYRDSPEFRTMADAQGHNL